MIQTIRLNQLLSLFHIGSYECGGGGYDDAVINLNSNYDRTNEKLKLLMKLNLKEN